MGRGAVRARAGQVGYTDTIVDLAAGMAGSVVAGLLVVAWRRHHARQMAVATIGGAAAYGGAPVNTIAAPGLHGGAMTANRRRLATGSSK